MGDVWESDGVVVETWESSTEPGVTFSTVIREGDIVTGGSGVDLSDATPAALGTAAPGVGTEASRADHVHGMPTAADVGAAAASHTHNGTQVTIDASGFDGNLTTGDDTVQKVAQKVDDLATGGGGPDLSDTAPQDLGTAAAGVSSEASRADHVHDMPTAADIAVDASGFNGNLTTSDDTVQEIAQKLDDLSVSTGTGGFTRSLMLGGM